MKTIGLIGGLSWISSREYYSILNTEYNLRKGNNHSCPVVMCSLDFNEVENLQQADKGVKLCELMSEAAIKVEKGAEGIILGCTELPLILGEAKLKIPVYNSTLIHAIQGLDFAMKEHLYA